MNWLSAFMASSVGRKFVMGVTGLFLCLFLVVHLSGNLLLYADSTGEAYNNYAHALHSNEELLLIAEVLLFAAFGFHILYAITLTIGNTAARQTYEVKQSKVEGRIVNMFGYTPDATMMFTGLLVLLFLVVHLNDFKIEGGWKELIEGMEPAEKAKFVVSHASRLVIYGLGAAALGFHVSHGLASACQSVGFNHPKYAPLIKKISIIFGIVVAVGFISFPIVF